MTEKDIALSRIEDSVILEGDSAKTVETSTEFVNYFFFSATSINYTASTMTLKYDAITGWVPGACLVICTNDPNGETYAIRIITPKFSSSTSDVEYRTVYAVGSIQTNSPLINSGYNIGVRTNGCPEMETFELIYTTRYDETKQEADYNPNIIVNAEYLVGKNIELFTTENSQSGTNEATMLNIVARTIWDRTDSDWESYSVGTMGEYQSEAYKSCETGVHNAKIYKKSNANALPPGFFKESGETFVALSYQTYFDKNIKEGRFIFNEPLEAIGYHTFYFGKHFNETTSLPSPDVDDYIGYDDGHGNYNYYPHSDNTYKDNKFNCESGGTGDNQIEFLHDEANYILSIKTGKYVKTIGNQAFKKLTSLEEIDFQGSPVERIGMFAFERTESLRNFNMPETVTMIGEGAFKYSSISAITIPHGLKYIEEETFKGCSQLETVNFDNCTGLTKICANAFRGCDNSEFTSVSLPNSLERIEQTAFAECSYLKTVKFGENIKYVGHRAFDKTSLESIDLSKATGAVIGVKAFRLCNLQEVILPVSGKCMSGAFCENKNDNGISLTIPKGFLFDEYREKKTAFKDTAIRKVIFLAKNLSEIAAGDDNNVPFFNLYYARKPSDCYIDLYIEKGIWDVIQQGTSYSGDDRFAQWLIKCWINNYYNNGGDIYTRDNEESEYYKVHSRLIY